MTYIDRFRDWMDRPGEHETSAESVFVVGLGRFGTALASTLTELGVEVLAVDTDVDLVNAWADTLTHVRVADGSSATALQQLGIEHFDAAVVAIGTGIEASILSTAALVDAGVPTIWAKAITLEHGRILERVGAHHVVFPEKEMGERVAHAVTGEVVDYFKLDEGFVIAELQAPGKLVGKTLIESGTRRDFNVTVVCVKPVGSSFTYATADTVVGAGDLLVIAGSTEDVERFTNFAAH